MKLTELKILQQKMQQDPTLIGDPECLRQKLMESGLRMDTMYQELEMEDRYVDTHEDSNSTPGTVQLHSHNFFEILYVCEGDLHYLVGTERYRIQKGDVILIPPGVSHQPMLMDSDSSNYRRYVLWISPAYIAQITPLFPPERLKHPSLLRIATVRRDHIEMLFYEGIQESEKRKPCWQAALYGNTLKLVSELYRMLLDSKTVHIHSEKPELLNKILAYIENNLQQSITLEDTAHKFYVSQSTVSNVFRREMNISFHRCVTQRRLIAAKEQIVRGLPLQIVAEQVGFSDYSSFYRAFKREYGISPQQYRNVYTNT